MLSNFLYRIDISKDFITWDEDIYAASWTKAIQETKLRLAAHVWINIH